MSFPGTFRFRLSNQHLLRCSTQRRAGASTRRYLTTLDASALESAEGVCAAGNRCATEMQSSRSTHISGHERYGIRGDLPKTILRTHPSAPERLLDRNQPNGSSSCRTRTRSGASSPVSHSHSSHRALHRLHSNPSRARSRFSWRISLELPSRMFLVQSLSSDSDFVFTEAVVPTEYSLLSRTRCLWGHKAVSQINVKARKDRGRNLEKHWQPP